MQILLSRTQAGPGRAVKQEQEETSRNHVLADLRTVFQDTPVCKPGYLGKQYCQDHTLLVTNRGILKNSTPKMPQFLNRQNRGIMSRIHLFPRDLWERCSPRASKTVLGLRLLRSLQSSDSFGGPWTASFPGSLGKRWNLGPIFIHIFLEIATQ